MPCGLPTSQCAAAPAPDPYAPAAAPLFNSSLFGPRPEPAGTDLGPCVCDLLAAACDANCACDPDCTATDK